MKISDFQSKTSLEVSDTDLLIIEDGEDTKSISVAELKKVLSSNTETEKYVKERINETLDNIAASITASKYVLTELKPFKLITWIGSTSGNVQIALQDLTTNKFLTMKDIAILMEFVDEVATNEFKIQLVIANMLKTATRYSVCDFNTEHENAHDVNPALSDANAGFIKAHFDGLTQNEIAGVTYDDIRVSLLDTDKFRYSFVGNPDSFANAVSYEEDL